MKSILLLAILHLNFQKGYSQTQGDQEIAWVKDIYSKSYSDTLYKKYQNSIQEQSSNSYRLDNRILLTFGESNELKMLINNGLFYPQLITGDSTIKYSPEVSSYPLRNFFQNDTLSIGNFHEVSVAPKNFKKKRYMLYVFRKGHANPSLYTLEITDNSATENTPVSLFFKNASLTFLKFISRLI